MQSSSVGGLAAREMRERCQAGTAGGRPMGSFAQLDERTDAPIFFLSRHSNRQRGRGKGIVRSTRAPNTRPKAVANHQAAVLYRAGSQN